MQSKSCGTYMSHGEIVTRASIEGTVPGGNATVDWSISAGSLPPGLSLGGTTGVISGTPTAPGTYNFTVRTADPGEPSFQDTQALTIIITAP